MKRRLHHGSSSRCAPPATIARSSTTPATPWASSAIHPPRGRSSFSGTSTPSPATFPFASRPQKAPKAQRARAVRPRQRRRQGAARDFCRGRGAIRVSGGEGRRSPCRGGWRGRRRSGHQQGRALHRIALRWEDRADPDRVHHRRAESLESRHAGLQGTAAARLHRRSANGAHRRSRCERRVGGGGLLELGHRACREDQRRQGQGVRSAQPEPPPLHHLDQRRRCTTSSMGSSPGAFRSASTRKPSCTNSKNRPTGQQAIRPAGHQAIRPSRRRST